MKKYRSYDPGPGLPLTLAFLFIALMIGAVYNEAVYGDWTCLFANCVKIANVKK